jgi:zinc and cadmium transporter
MSFLYAIGSVLIISAISFIGAITLTLSDVLLRRIIILLVSFSAGALLGDAFIHLLPEIVEEQGFTLSISLGVLGGILFSFILEKFIHWHHCHSPGEHAHPVAYINLFGDAIHNFIDGLIIGASYLVSVEVGIATTVAVILHEIPQELGDFGVLIHAGFSKFKALLFNMVSALAAVLGVAAAYFLTGLEIEHLLIPFAVGNFIYIACADLIPELHKEVRTQKSLLQLLFFVLGIALMAGLLFFE